MANPAGGPEKSKPQAGLSRAETSELAAKIARARGQKLAYGTGEARSQADMTALSRGLRIGAEFAAAILVGAGLGYLFDRAFNTAPWGLLGLFMLGFAAGILNVTRVVAEMNKAAPLPPPGTEIVPDEEEDEA